MLESIKINPASRPEQLSAAEFAKIANQLYLIHT
jgi:16S rRNA A1518/A1519 N6-dimethyltransferase RsmA/KsgA/DIM1 with predicted DNA glycosylase/AP lyase activity